ncbi:MAG: histidine kinase [Oscillospiraceae bacterium]|nr:histidine kinase [Oscillospiraceae bacterium]
MLHWFFLGSFTFSTHLLHIKSCHHYSILHLFFIGVFFVAAMISVLQVIPNSINTLAKAKELETEKRLLNAQLAESRVSTMMSQIRPYFIYNTLGSIEQLCSIDPPKAGELVHNFAKYLRGNFGELDNPKPILISQERKPLPL